MSECVLSELGAYNLLQARPCLVADLLCVAAGTTIRVYSVLSGKFKINYLGFEILPYMDSLFFTFLL